MNFEIEQVDPLSLSFDYQNPRIAEFNLTEKAPEEEIIKILWDVMGVEEIVLSIKSSGFFQHEPLIAVNENSKLVVIEGNRRLAAIKCILNPSIADYISLNKNNLRVSKEVKNELKAIPVILVNDREEAWKFIGFKHINGPAKWGSYAKAQYISQIKNEYNIPLSDIAVQLGDTHKTVQKLYQGLQVIEQAENINKFDKSDIYARRLYFSHLYTALTYEGVREYLGIKDVAEETSDPVPEGKEDELELLLLWLFGSKKKQFQPVIHSQNPDLRRLEAVVKVKEATYALASGQPLIVAYELSQPKNQTFEQSLLDAKRALQKAQSYQTEGFDGTDEGLLRLAGTISNIAEDIYETMLAKYEAAQNKENGKKKRLSE